MFIKDCLELTWNQEHRSFLLAGMHQSRSSLGIFLMLHYTRASGVKMLFSAFNAYCTF